MNGIRNYLWITFILAALFAVSNCEQATSPGRGTDGIAKNRGLDGYVLDTLTIYSGNGECGEYDTLVHVSSPCDNNWMPALIGGGSDSAACACETIGEPDYISLPVATRCNIDSVGYFRAHFELPERFRDVLLRLGVIADDGALVHLNETMVAEVDLGNDPPIELVFHDITGDSLFLVGENTLLFHVVNTGTGEFGEPAARADTADCMYLEFIATVYYDTEPIVTIDVKPGSDVNPINCKVENGVIPVAILTTGEFDATDVDHTTVRFGPDGAMETHANKHGTIRHMEDVDFDGDMDLVFHFRSFETGIACGDTLVTLWGETFGGRAFTATDHIRTVGEKKDDDGDD